MSTILKALKQAERDCPDQENENSPSFNVRTVLNPRMQQKRNNFLSTGRLVILLAVVIGVAIIFYVFSPNNQVTPQPASVGKGFKALDTRTPEPVHQAPVKKALSKKIKEQPLTPLAPGFLKKLATPPLQQKIIPEETAPLIGDAPTSGQSIIKESIKGEKKLLKATSPEPTLLPLENDSLKVQAISWDKSPANRIAVIDNRVLREGDFVQGYCLVNIEKDSVILNYSGNDYRLRFRYR